MRVALSILSLCIVWGLSAPATANKARPAKSPAPESIPGVTQVDAEGLLSLIARLPGLTVIDARVPMDRRHGYIEGSANLPDVETDCASLRTLTAGQTAPVLFYCNGVKCGRSANSIRIARACGHTRVYWFRGGIEEWRQKGYPLLKARHPKEWSK